MDSTLGNEQAQTVDLNLEDKLLSEILKIKSRVSVVIGLLQIPIELKVLEYLRNWIEHVFLAKIKYVTTSPEKTGKMSIPREYTTLVKRYHI